MRRSLLIFFSLGLMLSRAWSGDGKPPAFSYIRDSVDVQLHAVKATLLENHAGLAYLEVTNNSSDSLTVRLICKGPDNVHITSLPESTTLSPGNGFVFVERLSVGNQVYPGSGMVLYQVMIDYKKNGRSFTASKVVTQEVELGILGESGIMTVLGLSVFSIPFFLILPGFLFWVIWSSFLPAPLRSDKIVVPSDKKEPLFWVLSITLSLILSLFYAGVSRRAVWIGYGLQDIFFLWMGSIVLSLILLSLYILIERSKDFSLEDKPLDLLRKLNRRGTDFFLQQGALPEVKDRLLFRLGMNKMSKAGDPAHWYSYGIQVGKAEGANDGYYKRVVELVRKLDEAEKRSGEDIKQLEKLLRKAKRKKAITVDFDVNPGLVSSAAEFVVQNKYKDIVHL
ncbi:MAG TPA: hypothetical protein VHE34_09920 [Puia sp.]|uniref:hypothetical protein n=1 Tax=Puia sp. TaxID=2045100 RepID=UPI002C91C609|nr:hypothetical protein [Puia sp.]HVU95532.1 hypothetical protein [Puia sp.]